MLPKERMNTMKKSYYEYSIANFMLLDKIEEKERRQKIEAMSMEVSMLDKDIRSTLEHIKN